MDTVAPEAVVSTADVLARKVDLQDCLVGLDHLAIAVPDLDEAIRWYTQQLGLRLIERRTTLGERTGMISAVLDAHGIGIVLIQGTEPSSQVSRFVSEFGPGVQHIAFEVHDLDVAMRGVHAGGGVADTPVIEGKGIRQVFLRRDPGSGVRVELIERKGGTFSDDTVQQLFLAFEANDLY